MIHGIPPRSITRCASAAPVRAALAALFLFALAMEGCDWSSSSPESPGTDIDQSTIIPVEDGAVWVYRVGNASNSPVRGPSSSAGWVVLQVDSVLSSVSGMTFRLMRTESTQISAIDPFTSRDTTYASHYRRQEKFKIEGDSVWVLQPGGTWSPYQAWFTGWPVQFIAVADSSDSSKGRSETIISSAFDRRTIRSTVSYGDRPRQQSDYELHTKDGWCNSGACPNTINNWAESRLRMTWVSGIGYTSMRYQDTDSSVDGRWATTKDETAELLYQGNVRTGATMFGTLQQDARTLIKWAD